MASDNLAFCSSFPIQEFPWDADHATGLHLGRGWILRFSQESSNTFSKLPFHGVLSELMWNKWYWIMSEEKSFGVSQKMLSPSRSTSSCSSKQGSRQVIQIFSTKLKASLRLDVTFAHSWISVNLLNSVFMLLVLFHHYSVFLFCW